MSLNIVSKTIAMQLMFIIHIFFVQSLAKLFVIPAFLLYLSLLWAQLMIIWNVRKDGKKINIQRLADKTNADFSKSGYIMMITLIILITQNLASLDSVFGIRLIIEIVNSIGAMALLVIAPTSVSMMIIIVVSQKKL